MILSVGFAFLACWPIGKRPLAYNNASYVLISIQVVSILSPRFWRQQIDWSYVPPVEHKHSVTWHDTIRMKRLVCHAVGALLVA